MGRSDSWQKVRPALRGGKEDPSVGTRVGICVCILPVIVRFLFFCASSLATSWVVIPNRKNAVSYNYLSLPSVSSIFYHSADGTRGRFNRNVNQDHAICFPVDMQGFSESECHV